MVRWTICDLARREIRHWESSRRLELGLGHGEPVKFGLKLVNRHYDARQAMPSVPWRKPSIRPASIITRRRRITNLQHIITVKWLITMTTAVTPTPKSTPLRPHEHSGHAHKHSTTVNEHSHE